ncbi:hypothetical protein PENSPDRAFT_630872, partial [Peniophora sp. CONT]
MVCSMKAKRKRFAPCEAKSSTSQSRSVLSANHRDSVALARPRRLTSSSCTRLHLCRLRSTVILAPSLLRPAHRAPSQTCLPLCLNMSSALSLITSRTMRPGTLGRRLSIRSSAPSSVSSAFA